MLLNILGIVIGVVNPRILAWIMRHGTHLAADQKIKHNIDEGFTGKFYSQLTCPGCGKQKEFRLHGFKAINDLVGEIMGDPKKK